VAINIKENGKTIFHMAEDLSSY